MTMLLRVRTLFVLVLAFGVFAGGAAQAATPKKPSVYQPGNKVKLRLADHSKINGTISAVGADSVDVKSKDGSLLTVPLANVVSSKDGGSFGERFRSQFTPGPCVGPLTLAIASPFILVATLLGH